VVSLITRPYLAAEKFLNAIRGDRSGLKSLTYWRKTQYLTISLLVLFL
jgi:hypothetical protein